MYNTLSHTLIFSLMLLLFISPIISSAATCGSNSAAYAELVNDDDIKTFLHLPDARRGVIQILATHATSYLQRPGIAGTLAAIQQAEAENLLPFHLVNVTQFSYTDVSEDYSKAPAVAQAILSLIQNNSGNVATFPYTGVLGLDYAISESVMPVITSNVNTSSLPLINPLTGSSVFYTKAYPNVLHSRPSFLSELLHIIRFAFINLNCANTDLHMVTISGFEDFVALINTMYTAAGFPLPGVIVAPAVGTPNATENQIFVEEVLTRGMDQRNVQCVIVIDTFRKDLHDLLIADPRGVRYFQTTTLLHFSTGATTLPHLNATEAAIYSTAFFTSTNPDNTTATAQKYKAALNAFNANHSEMDHQRLNGGIITNFTAGYGFYPGDVTEASQYGFEHYVATRWLLELIANVLPSPEAIVKTKMEKQGVCNVTALNFTAAFPDTEFPLSAPSTKSILNAAFDTRCLISYTFPLGPLTPTKCLLTYDTTATDCFCNVAGKILYMSKYNLETQRLDVYNPTNDFGYDASVTTIVPERQCSLTTADIATSLPSTLIYITTGNETADLFELVTVPFFQAVTAFANSVGTLTTTMRFTHVNATGYTEYEAQRAYAEAVNSTAPYATVGSGSKLSFLRESNSRATLDVSLSGNFQPLRANISTAPINNVLSLVNGIDDYELQDPPLVAYNSWNGAHVNLKATFADHAHSLAAYYNSLVSTASPPSSLAAIVETSAQAALVQKSFNSFQHAITVTVLESIGVSQDNFRNWIKSAVEGGGSRPFVFVGLMTNTTFALELLYIINGTEGKAVTSSKSGLRFALASIEETAYKLFSQTAVNIDLEMLTNLQSGFNADMFSAAPTTSNLNVSTIFTRTNKLTVNLSASDVGDIVFASHMNEWYLPRSTSVIVSPKLFRRLEVTRVAFALLSSASQVSSRTGFGALYELINIAGISTSYGPFYNTACSASIIQSGTANRNCQCAKGPRMFEVISFLDFYSLKTSSRTGNFMYTNEGCGVVYHDLKTSSSLQTTDIATIAGAAGGFIVLVGTLITLCCCCRRAFTVRHAPQDSSFPFAMAFTDIQSSTTLWSRVPEAMAVSVDVHHSLLRDCVKKYNGYEVKTIGDSFMVAFRTSEGATTFALGVQKTLFNFEDWAPELDETYIETLLDAQKNAEDNEEGEIDINQGAIDRALNALSAVEANCTTNGTSPRKPHGSTFSPKSPDPRKINKIKSSVYLPLDPETGALDQETYDRLWKGLRVRVGVHFGTGDIKRDPVSDRFDYYGTVVNTAARVEGVGHGGQVLLTEDAFQALPANFETQHEVNILDLGPQPLRGLDAPVKLFQLTPKAFGDRVYPPLRLDVEKGAEEIETDDNTDDDDSNSNSTSNPSNSSNNQALTQFNIARKKYLNSVDPWSTEAAADKIVAKEMKMMLRGKAMVRRNSNSTTASATDVFSPLSKDNTPVVAHQTVWDRDPETESSQRRGSLKNGDAFEVAHLAAPDNVPQTPQITVNPAIDPASPYTPTPTTSKTLRTRENKENDLLQQKVDVWISRHDSARTKVLAFYYFMETVLSTSTKAHRNDTVSHLCKKWHIKAAHSSEKLHQKLEKRQARLSRRGSAKSQQSQKTHQSAQTQRSRGKKSLTQEQQDVAYDQMYLLMSLCAKVGKAATVRQAQATGKICTPGPQ